MAVHSASRSRRDIEEKLARSEALMAANMPLTTVFWAAIVSEEPTASIF
jgi:hypothetical protein